MSLSPAKQRDKQKIDEFLSELTNCNSEDSIKTLCEEWLQKIKAYCLEYAKKDASGNPVFSVNSYNNKIVLFRNSIVEWQKSTSLNQGNSYKAGEEEKEKSFRGRIHYAYKFLKETKQFYRDRTAQTLEKSENRLLESEVVSVEIIEQYIEIAKKLIVSHDWREVVAGVIALSGRRFIEGVKTAKFVPVSRYKVRFTGQVKHGREDYEMFSLIESHSVAKELNRCRKMLEIKELSEQELSQITNDKNSTVNNVVREHFSGIVPVLPEDKGTGKLSTRSLRYLYAAIASYWFKPSRMNDLKFYQEVLGHKSKVAAFSYVAYQVCDSQNNPLTTGVNMNLLELEAQEIEKRSVTNIRIYEDNKQELLSLQQEWGYESQAELIDHLIKYAKLGMISAPTIQPVSNSIQAEKTEVKEVNKVDEVDLSSVSFEELNKDYKTHLGSAEERMRRTVQAIKDFNDYVASENSQRWRITTSAVAQLSGSRSDRVAKFFEKYADDIESHNQKYSFSAYHNRGKGDVREVIKVK